MVARYGWILQERLTRKDQKISENFFARGDGTRAYYFSEHSLLDLFEGQGFTCKAVKVHCRQIENRSRALVMNRRWIQGEFCLLQSDLKSKHEENGVEAENDIDLSEGVAALFEPNLSLEVGCISIDNNSGIKK
jgi:methyltransferase-like protein 6